MGWTGVILTARFQLMRFPGAKVHQTTVRADTLENLLQTFDAHYARHEYAAAWIDCLASGKNLGRGAIYFGRHLAEKATPPTTFQAPTALNIPGFAPSWLLNRHSIQCYNQWVWYRSQSGEKTMGLHAYFYPLDQLKNWNRLYGRRGFLQYQFCIPEARAAEALQKAIALIQRGPDRPFLSVLKRHGDRPPEALHSFPIRGWSLALDFPRTTTIFGLIQQLDDLIWEYGGKVYLAKDAASHGRMGRVDPKVFGNAQFDSHLKQRILNTL
jgi:FAD/FMN-containing dehydrogenase